MPVIEHSIMKKMFEIKSFLDMKVKTKELKKYLTSKTGKRVITKIYSQCKAKVKF